jgi:hypothetical protein
LLLADAPPSILSILPANAEHDGSSLEVYSAERRRGFVNFVEMLTCDTALGKGS